MEKRDKVRLEIQEHGTMLSDYFHGTSGVMLSINIDKKSTCKDVLDMIEDEINMIWDHIEYVAKYHGYDTSILEYHIEAEQAKMANYVMNKGDMNKPFNPDLDFDFDEMPEDDFEELPVAIFSIEFIEE